MKKITLLLVALWSLGFLSAQTPQINITTNWPDTSWSIGGSYASSNLVSNPTINGGASSFLFDDNLTANSGDFIHLVSPKIDLTNAYIAGETGLKISFKIAYSTSTTNTSELLKIQYWDPDANSGTGKWKQFSGGSQADSGSLGTYSSCTYDTNNSTVNVYLDFLSFSSTQKQLFKIRFVYEDGGLSQGGGACISAVTFTSLSCTAPTNLNLVSIGTDGAQIGWTANNGERRWQVDWGTAGFNHTGGSVMDTDQNPTGLSSLSEQTSYDVYVRADCSDGDGAFFSAWSNKFNFVTMMQDPNNLTVNNITKTSVDISWGYPGAQTKWNVEYGPQGYTRGSSDKTANFVSTDNTTNPISGLTAGTTYDFYVQAQADNSAVSNWVSGSFTTIQSYETAVSLDISNWDNLNCGTLQQNGTGLRVYGTEYRVGAWLENKTFYDLRNAEALFKWKINNNGWGLATTANINLIAGYQLTMSNINADHWYYTHIYINSDKTYSIKVADNNYDDEGGTVLYNNSGAISDAKWSLLASDNVMIEFNDNYGGSACYLDVDEVRLRHAVALDNSVNDSNKTTYNFEDGALPSDFVFADNTWSNDSSSGYNGTHGLQAIVPVNQNSSALLTVINTKRISFDVKYNGDIHKSARLMIDGNTVAEFDRSTSWCWKHVEWQLPDDAQHEISWYIAGSVNDEHAALLVIDNVIIYKSDAALGLDKLNLDEFKFFPNPTSGIIKLNAQESIEQVELYNLLGQQLIIKQPNVSTYQLNISTLKAGIYFMKVTVADKTGTYKVLKQ